MMRGNVGEKTGDFCFDAFCLWVRGERWERFGRRRDSSDGGEMRWNRKREMGSGRSYEMRGFAAEAAVLEGFHRGFWRWRGRGRRRRCLVDFGRGAIRLATTRNFVLDNFFYRFH